MNELAKNISDSEDVEQKERLKTEYAEKKAQLDTRLDELDKIRQKRNAILKLVGVGVGTAGVAGILTGIFEAVANAIGSDTAKDLLPKSTDPKDIAASGIGKMIKKKLSELASYFHHKFLTSTGTVKAFWHMMENSVKYIQDNIWIIIAAALAIAAYEVQKKKKN